MTSHYSKSNSEFGHSAVDHQPHSVLLPRRMNFDTERMVWIAIAVVLACLFGRAAVADNARHPSDDSLIANGSFADWDNDQPRGWVVELGAQNGGRAPQSNVNKGSGPSLVLSGDANTLGWNLVRQSVSIEPGKFYRLQFAAKANDLRREGNQFDNCYVGALLKNAGGEILARPLTVVSSDAFLPATIYFRAPEGVATADVIVFLSKSGTLEVKEIKLHGLESESSFDILAEEMNRSYSFFDLKRIDWQAVVKKYRQKAEAAKSPKAFANVVAQMLAELKDIHTWVMIGETRISKYKSTFAPNYDFKIVDAELTEKKSVGGFGLTGRTGNGWGYVRISTLANVDQQLAARMTAAIESLFDAPGMIIDIRQNGGGAEPLGQAIAAQFTDDEVQYARQKIRSGPKHSDFLETPPRRLAPSSGSSYNKPVVCLVGPGTVSSAEGMALMFKALPHCVLVGKSTRGASGNPAPVTLPNGVNVYFSRWLSMELDGTAIEGSGVRPTIEVEHQRGSDPAFERAQELLREKSVED